MCACAARGAGPSIYSLGFHTLANKANARKLSKREAIKKSHTKYIYHYGKKRMTFSRRRRSAPRWPCCCCTTGGRIFFRTRPARQSARAARGCATFNCLTLATSGCGTTRRSSCSWRRWRRAWCLLRLCRERRDVYKIEMGRNCIHVCESAGNVSRTTVHTGWSRGGVWRQNVAPNHLRT